MDLLHGRSESDVNVEALALAIQTRNSAFGTWGFKVPSAIGLAKLLLKMLRNPYFIFVFRDPLATSIRENPQLLMLY